MAGTISRNNRGASIPLLAKDPPVDKDSNIDNFITSPDELLEPEVLKLLQTIPDVWQEYNFQQLTSLQAQGRFLLVAAGMVECKHRVRVQMFNSPMIAEATFSATGEYGFVDALEPFFAALWEDWKEPYLEWKKSETATAPSSHCQALEPAEWRLTDQGVLAREDIAKGNSSRPLDFIFKRGAFDGQLRMMPDGRISQREHVRGYGRLLNFEKKREEPSAKAPKPTTEKVNVANWDEGSDAFAAAFEKMMPKMFEMMHAHQNQVQDIPSPSKEPAPAKETTQQVQVQLDTIVDMLDKIQKGALLQVGQSNFAIDEIKEKFEALPPSRKKAWNQYFRAQVALRNCTDREAYEWCEMQLEEEETMPTFSTWSRYVRDARRAMGLQKNTPGRPIPTGKSVVTPDDVDPSYYLPNSE